MPRGGGGAAGRFGTAAMAVGVVLGLGTGLAACASTGTVGKAAQPAGSTGSSPSASIAGGQPGRTQSSSSSVPASAPAPPTPTPTPETTVAKDEAAKVLKDYESANNAANAAADTAAIAKIETGSLLAVDQVTYLYMLGNGGDKLAQLKKPTALTNPTFYIPHTNAYPRGFFVTVQAVQSGVANTDWLLHFVQGAAGAPWQADSLTMLASGKQWPEFAVGPDGLLDASAVQPDKLAMTPVDLVAADRTMLADNNPGQPASPFLNDEVTAAELQWVRQESDSVAPATVALTVTTDQTPSPLLLPLKNGGELVVWGSRLSLHISQAGQTFPFADPGWAKVAGRENFHDAFTADAVYTFASVDPADNGAKIEKIAKNGGVVALR